MQRVPYLIIPDSEEGRDPAKVVEHMVQHMKYNGETLTKPNIAFRGTNTQHSRIHTHAHTRIHARTHARTHICANTTTSPQSLETMCGSVWTCLLTGRLSLRTCLFLQCVREARATSSGQRRSTGTTTSHFFLYLSPHCLLTLRSKFICAQNSSALKVHLLLTSRTLSAQSSAQLPLIFSLAACSRFAHILARCSRPQERLLGADLALEGHAGLLRPAAHRTR